MRKFLTGVTALLGVIGLSQVAEAQTLRMMKALDAPRPCVTLSATMGA